MSEGPTHWYTTLTEAGVWTAMGGAIAWLTGLLWRRVERKDAIAEKRRAREDKIAEHSGSLALELLKIANGEVKMLKEQIAGLSSQMGRVSELERRLGYFEESLFHIEQLLDPDGGLGRAAAESHARLFLGKMIILREAKGVANNREQAQRAAHALTEKGEDHAE